MIHWKIKWFVSQNKNTPDQFAGDFFQKQYLLVESVIPPILLHFWIALDLLANLKETHKVKWACRVEATSIMSVVKE